MEYSEIKILLEKYWNCNSTLEEEQILRDFFDRETIPDDLLPYASLFRFYKTLEVRESSLSLDTLQKIGKGMRPDPGHGNLPVWKIIYRAAAILLIGISVFMTGKYIHHSILPGKKMVKDTYSDPHKALAETRGLLMMISTELNKGEAQASRISEFHKAESILKNEKN